MGGVRCRLLCVPSEAGEMSTRRRRTSLRIATAIEKWRQRFSKPKLATPPSEADWEQDKGEGEAPAEETPTSEPAVDEAECRRQLDAMGGTLVLFPTNVGLPSGQVLTGIGLIYFVLVFLYSLMIIHWQLALVMTLCSLPVLGAVRLRGQSPGATFLYSVLCTGYAAVPLLLWLAPWPLSELQLELVNTLVMSGPFGVLRAIYILHAMAPKKGGGPDPRKQKQAFKAQKKRERRSLKIVDAPAPSKRKRRERNRDPAEKQVPLTIESMRRFDETLVRPDDAEVAAEERIDEFASHFRGEVEPKLYLTTSRRPSEKMRTFVKELLLILPNVFYFARDEYKLEQMVKEATRGGFSAILLVTQGPRKLPNGLYICSLPYGPTTFFRLTSLLFASDMKGGGAFTESKSEIILNHFDTRVGRRVGRQIASLFPLDPEFEARRVITFHNQRDMIFFRHHRCVSHTWADRAQIRVSQREEVLPPGDRAPVHAEDALGPGGCAHRGADARQEGTLDLDKGLFEFVWRPDLQVDRKTFFI
ncbi:RNA processing factor [Babesia caballi]|uniref:RNA processing factor n=1 Tax=Babesia caballi TaxID=5871 RepID=A0AAV4LYH6_BABCB|nr:RNA processing factor [Babesia caballi]